MRRSESEALTALLLDELVQIQHEQTRRLAEMQGHFPAALQAVSEQLHTISIQQSQTAEREAKLHQRLMDAHDGTADLVVAALDQCQTILDVDNTILESIDRRLRAGGK